MSKQNRVPRSIAFRCSAAVLAGLQVFAGASIPAYAQSTAPDSSTSTKTPIKHVIVIIGENRTFDHIFATYKPVHGESVNNLLSEGIVNADGSAGPNYSFSRQNSAIDNHAEGYKASPMDKSLYRHLPTPLAGGPTVPYIPTVAEAEAVETGLPNTKYYTYLTTGGTGLTAGTPDTRIPNVNNLPSGPFQITPGIP
jgi:phospholipase C